MRELNNFNKLFNENFERKMFVYHNAHKLCEGRCKCQRQEIWVKFPHILETKDNDFCQKHNLVFRNELHKLPSGKEIWLGCPSCEALAKQKADRRSFELDMQDSGMRFDHETNEWYKPEQTKKPAANEPYIDTRSLAFKD